MIILPAVRLYLDDVSNLRYLTCFPMGNHGELKVVRSLDEKWSAPVELLPSSADNSIIIPRRLVCFYDFRACRVVK